MQQALRQAGCRITGQRKAILDYLASTALHPSARQVFAEVSQQVAGLSLATVYNTLGTLVRLGLVRVMEFETMDNRHETDLAPHINLVCMVCGRIQDFGKEVTLYEEAVEETLGFEIESHRLEYYGTCAQCRSRALRGAPALSHEQQIRKGGRL